jgi:GTP-binding protein
MFIDYAEISVKAGQGGSGCMSFRREKFVSKGGPDGGDGGKGGSVYLVVDPNMHTLIDFKYRPQYKAKRGTHGMGSGKHGKNAPDTFIKVPQGTVVKDIKTGTILCDMIDPEEKFEVAKGGRGGKGNARFVTPTNRSPREWEVGFPGEEKDISLELKLIADIGLVGFPNAGKSTLLSRISAAHPKIADYPFTTLSPNLGIVKYQEYHSFVVADIPGLIEGSHTGKGLGHKFLKHIERTRALAFIIDINDENPDESLKILLHELREFSTQLPVKPHIVLFSKSDTWQTENDSDRNKVNLSSDAILFSSVTGDNLPQVIESFYQIIQQAKESDLV